MKTEDFNALVAKAINLTIAQGKPSVDDKGFCVYSGKGGLRCVIGQILPEHTLSQVLENNPSANAYQIVGETVWGRQFDKEQRVALQTLQQCHDTSSRSCSFVEEFEKEVSLEGFVWK